MPDTLTIFENEKLWVPNEGGQEQFFEDYDTFVCGFVGGWFSGKTWAGARKLANIHVHNALDDKGQPTYVRGMAVAQTFPLARTQSIPELQQAFEEMGLSYKFVADPKRYCFELPDLGTKSRPSELLIRSAESPQTINSFTVGHAWGDEPARWPEDKDNPKNDPVIQLYGRVRDPRAKVLQINFTFTHEGDTTGMFENFEGEERQSDHKLYRAPTTENPYARAFAERTGRLISPMQAEQYLKGFAIKTRGTRMYSTYEREIHESPDVKLLMRLPLDLSLDFNISPGMHGLLGQYDAIEDQFTTRHEIHEESMAVPDLVDALDNILRTQYHWKMGSEWPWARGRLQVYGDASGGNEHASRGESCWDVLVECLKIKGIPFTIKIPSGNPRVSDRVNSVIMAMRDGRGRSHYTVFRTDPKSGVPDDCVRLRKDFRKLKWTLTGDIDKKNKKMSHPSDAEGYRIYFVRPIKTTERDNTPLRQTGVNDGE